MSNPIPWASFRHPLQNPTEKCYANASRQAEKLVQNIYSRCFYDHGLTMLHLGGAYKCMIEVYQAQSHSIHDLLLCQNHIVRSVKLSLFHPALNSCARSTPRTYKAFQFETSIQFQQRYGNEIAEMSPHNPEHAARISFKTERNNSFLFQGVKQNYLRISYGRFLKSETSWPSNPTGNSSQCCIPSEAFRALGQDPCHLTWHQACRMDSFRWLARNDSCLLAQLVASEFLVEAVLPDWLGPAPRAEQSNLGRTGGWYQMYGNMHMYWYTDIQWYVFICKHHHTYTMVLNGCLMLSVSNVVPLFGTTPDEIRCPRVWAPGHPLRQYPSLTSGMHGTGTITRKLKSWELSPTVTLYWCAHDAWEIQWNMMLKLRRGYPDSKNAQLSLPQPSMTSLADSSRDAGANFA